MSKTIIIAEKPSVAQDIVRAFLPSAADEGRVTAAVSARLKD